MNQLYPFTDPIAAEATPPKRMVRGEGAYVTDDAGHTYLDAVAALWCSPLGFNNARLAKAAHRQMQELAYYHSFMGRTCSVTEKMASTLVQRLPGDLAHVFFGTSGSDGVDSAIKLMQFYQSARGKPGKTRIIARHGAYHGSGVLSGAATGMSYCHDGFALPTDHVLRVSRPHYYQEAWPGEDEAAFTARLASELDSLILQEGADTIGAFIGEPAMGAGGVILPPDGYWAAVQKVLTTHDILLIADETITGFGRTGRWFGCQTYDIAPDILTMAKQLTASYFPLSAVAISDKVGHIIAGQAHDFGTLGHGFTYGGHPVGAAVALETLAIYDEMDLPAHVGRMSGVLDAALEPARRLSAVGDVRIQGLLAGVELCDDTPLGADFGKHVGAEAEARGVFFRIIGNVLAIAPPYICTDDELRHMGQVMADSINAVHPA